MKNVPCQNVLVLAALIGAGCSDRAGLPVTAGFGPTPILPPPNQTLIPTTKVATGWPAGAGPVPAPGLAIAPYAGRHTHPETTTAADQAGPTSTGPRRR